MSDLYENFIINVSLNKDEGKGKMDLYSAVMITPLRCSGVACVLKGSHSFTRKSPSNFGSHASPHSVYGPDLLWRRRGLCSPNTLVDSLIDC